MIVFLRSLFERTKNCWLSEKVKISSLKEKASEGSVWLAETNCFFEKNMIIIAQEVQEVLYNYYI